jgi:2-polyprenyl-3-methyl-5-hydroxy-6-metoxy-1,4-benzoquinol methylase
MVHPVDILSDFFVIRGEKTNMQHDQSYYQSIWHTILEKYTGESPIRDLGDITRATLVARFLQQYAFTHGQQKEGYRIHDYGAGNWLYLGALFQVCGQQAHSIILKGIDYSEEALSFGLQKFRHLQPANVEVYIERSDILQTLSAQKEACVDCIICLETLEHVYADREIFRHYCRILKPGGTLIASVPNKRPFLLSYNWFSYVFFRQQFTTKDRRVGHVRRYTTASLLALVENTTMAVHHTELYGFFFSDYLKRIIAWMDHDMPRLGHYLFPLALRLLFLEHRWWNRFPLQSSEGIFVIFKKHE